MYICLNLMSFTCVKLKLRKSEFEIFSQYIPKLTSHYTKFIIFMKIMIIVIYINFKYSLETNKLSLLYSL